MAPLAHIPPKGESRALGYSEFASLAKQVHTTGVIHSGLDWHKIKTLGIVLSCVVKVIPLPVFLETMTIQCGIGQHLF